MTILPDRADERVDACIARLAPGISRSAAQRLCEDGQVLLNGAPAKKNARVAPGDVLELTLPEPQPTQAQAEDIPLDVAYEDADVIVINKPKGLVVHPAAGHWEGTLVNALLHHCKDSLSGVGGALRPGIVHRIDKDTSGLLIVAKNDFAHQKLAAQLQDHTLARTYVCIVCGKLREDAGTVSAPIARDKNDRKKMAIRADGKPAVTHWQVLARYPGYTYVQCKLETGRTHQIRVHMASLGHPILGDTVYGHKKPELGQNTQCLHAKELTFRHPRTDEPVTVTCPLPEEFARVLQVLEHKK